jgi:hypothetical protein
VLGTAQNLSTRTLAKGLLCAGILAAVLLLALAAAAGASTSVAEPVIAPSSSTDSTSEQPPESSTLVPATIEPAASEAAPSVPPVQTVVEEALPPPAATVEEVLLPPAATVVEEVLPPAAAPVVPPLEATPPSEAQTPTGTVKELVPAETTSKPGAEGTSDGDQASAASAGEGPPSTPPSSAGQIAAALASTPAGTQQNAAVPDGAAVEASSVLLGRLAVGSAGRSSGPPSDSGAGASAGGVPVAGLSAAQRAAELSCQLSGMAGTANDNCGASWLGTQISLSVQAVGFRAPTGSRTGPPGEGYGGSVGGSHPVMPAPAPAPSGAVGGSAGGGSGVSPAGFFTLAGLLLLAAPRALRRLRLSCQTWRTAFFVLIPERPG